MAQGKVTVRLKSPLVAVTILGLMVPTSGFAQSRPQVRAASSSLVFLRLAADRAGKQREQALIDALGLVLDDFGILSLSPEPGFDQLPLRGQIESVKKLAEQEDAAAAVWLAAASEPIMLHLVALQSDKTLIRSFEASKQARLATSMAIAVRELLGAAYLFEPEEVPSPALRTLVKTVLQEQLALHAPPVQGPVPVPMQSPQLEYGVRATGLFQQGLWGQRGPARRFGARLVGEIIVSPRMHFGLSAEFARWPEYVADGLRLSAWSVGPGIEWSTHWAVGPFSVGSVIALQLLWERFESVGEAKETQSTWRGQVQGGLDLRWRFVDGFGLYFSPRLEANFSQEAIVRRADDVMLAATPWLGFRLELGLVFQTHH